MKNLTRFIFAVVLFVGLFLTACEPPSTPQSASSQPQQQSASRTPVVEEVKGEISLDRNFYLVMDGSGSMNSNNFAGSFTNRLEAAKWAVEELITKSVPADVNLGLYVLEKYELVPLGKNNRGEIITAMKKLRPETNTPLNAAIIDGTKALVKQREKQLGYGEFFLVVATDGEATDGSMNRGVDYAFKNQIPIITIGFGIKNHPLKDRSLNYWEATSPQELLEALKETQAESAYFDSATFGKK